MPDHGTPPEGTTLAALADEVRSLKTRLQMLEAQGRSQTGVLRAETLTDEVVRELDANLAVSRRGAIKVLGAAAAGGVGMALGSTVLGAEQAGAANFQYVELGAQNTASQSTNILTSGGVGLGAGSQDATGTGVVGTNSSGSGGSGVFGLSESAVGIGIFGVCAAGIGVVGQDVDSDPNPNGTPNGKLPIGVQGNSDSGIGVQGVLTTKGIGFYAVDGEDLSGQATSVGVYGSSAAGTGVSGQSASGVGVQGTSSGTVAVLGTLIGSGEGAIAGEDHTTQATSYGVFGSSNAGYGMYCTSQSGLALFAALTGPGNGAIAGEDQSDQSTSYGVFGSSAKGIGVIGRATAGGVVGIQAANTVGPSLQLVPSASPLLPSTSQPGQFIVLSDNSLHYAYGPNEWVALTNGTFPIPPVRVINTADGTGGITGPLVPGSTVHTSVTIAGSHGIPAAAIGVVGNLAISGVGGALLNGAGFATLFAAGEVTPATANINAGAGCFAISNAVTVGLGVGGSNAGKLSLVWSGGGPVPHAEAYFDVTGYIL